MDYFDDQLRNIAGWNKDDTQLLSIVDNNRFFFLTNFSFNRLCDCLLVYLIFENFVTGNLLQSVPGVHAGAGAD